MNTVLFFSLFSSLILYVESKNNSGKGKEHEKDWDDSAMTNPVNPMEVGTEGPTTKRHGDPDPGHVLAGWVSEIRLGGSPSDEEALAEGLRE